MSDYLAHEGLEHAEKAREHLEGVMHPHLRMIPPVVAVLAVLAGLSSLYGNRLAETMLTQGNGAILAQSQASDLWNEYEADSLKAHLAIDLAIASSDQALKKRFHDIEKVYRTRQVPLKADAVHLESERTADLKLVDKADEKKLRFDVATGVFQISIVLASIAAMTRRPSLFYLALAGSVAGIVFCAIGLLL